MIPIIVPAILIVFIGIDILVIIKNILHVILGPTGTCVIAQGRMAQSQSHVLRHCNRTSHTNEPYEFLSKGSSDLVPDALTGSRPIVGKVGLEVGLVGKMNGRIVEGWQIDHVLGDGCRYAAFIGHEGWLRDVSPAPSLRSGLLRLVQEDGLVMLRQIGPDEGRRLLRIGSSRLLRRPRLGNEFRRTGKNETRGWRLIIVPSEPKLWSSLPGLVASFGTKPSPCARRG